MMLLLRTLKRLLNWFINIDKKFRDNCCTCYLNASFKEEDAFNRKALYMYNVEGENISNLKLNTNK